MLVVQPLDGSMPHYMSALFTHQSNASYNMKSEARGHLLIPQVKTELYRTSLAYSGAIKWNTLPASIRQGAYVSQFKTASFLFHMYN